MAKSLWDKIVDFFSEPAHAPDVSQFNTDPNSSALEYDEDKLSWSWDELTGGEREEATDEEVAAIALFAGVPEDEIESTKREYEELFND